MFFTTLGISGSREDYFALSIEENDVGDEINSHSATEIAVAVEKDVEFPPLAVNKGTNFFCILTFIGAHSDESNACFALPLCLSF